MLARVLSAAVNEIEAFPVEVEVNCGRGDTVSLIAGSTLPKQTTGGRPPRRPRRIAGFSIAVVAWPVAALCGLGFLPSISRAAPTNEMILRAMSALQAAAPRAQSDPARPIFHITAPAQWMNDPNGPIYYNGFYHLFYQLHPFSDGDGPKILGARPQPRFGEMGSICPSRSGLPRRWVKPASGPVAAPINGSGEPMIFYTSIAAGQSAQTHAEQWAAIGDEDLITWRKSPANPVLVRILARRQEDLRLARSLHFPRPASGPSW